MKNARSRVLRDFGDRERWRDRLPPGYLDGPFQDESKTDAELTAEANSSSGSLFEVATYADPFELRKVQLIFSVQDGVTAQEDARVVTFHLAKIAAGVVVSEWTAADFTNVVTPIDTMWTTVKALYANKTVYDRVKIYKAGPQIVPPQSPVYDVDKNVAGTSTANPMPPQVAISVTEIAGSKRHWGRFYMPNPVTTQGTIYGRLDSSAAGTLADQLDTMYESWRSNGIHPVVYRQALPERSPTATDERYRTKGTWPARPATAWDVEKLQIDDVFDVIRSRRFKYPLLRTQRNVGATG